MTSTWIHVYDETGKRILTETRSRFGDVVGYSSTFYIVKRGSFYVIYDANQKVLNTLLITNVGEMVLSLIATLRNLKTKNKILNNLHLSLFRLFI